MNQNVNPANRETIPKFVDSLPTPRIATPKTNKNFPPASYYELSMVEARHRFHKSFPSSKVWCFDGSIPGPTIEAKKDKVTFIKYIHDLPTKHFLPVDYTLHSVSDSPEVRTEDHDMMRPIVVINDSHPVQPPHLGEEH